MTRLLGSFNMFQPLWKYEFVNGKDYPIYEMENKKCHQPVNDRESPISIDFFLITIYELNILYIKHRSNGSQTPGTPE